MNDGAGTPRLVVYVDVDDTLIRTIVAKRVPIVEAIEHVRRLHAEGARLFCWSTGGDAYAREVADGLGIAALFDGFLPKPHVVLDDQPFVEWRRLCEVHPMQCEGKSIASYRATLDRPRRREVRR